MRYLIIAAVLLLLIPAVAAELTLPPGVQQLQNYQTGLALNVNFLLAFLAGIIGFVSPCGFAVFPAFFAFLFRERKRAVLLTASFALGMAAAFIAMGIAAGYIGTFFNELKREFATVSGALLIVFGLMLLFNKGFTFLSFRVDAKKKKTVWSMSVLGFFFALGWTPCVGPILSGILVLAANTGTVFLSALMLAAYAAGVAVPLLIVAFLSDKYDFARWAERGSIEIGIFGKTIRTHIYNLVGGLIFIALGALILATRGTQEIEKFFIERFSWTTDGLYHLNDVLIASRLTSSIANLAGIIILVLIAWLVWRAVSAKLK